MSFQILLMEEDVLVSPTGNNEEAPLMLRKLFDRL